MSDYEFAIENLSQQVTFTHMHIYPSFFFFGSLICLHTLYVHLYLVLTASIKPVDGCFFRPLVSFYWVVFKSMLWMWLDWLSIQLAVCGIRLPNISRKEVRRWSLHLMWRLIVNRSDIDKLRCKLTVTWIVSLLLFTWL